MKIEQAKKQIEELKKYVHVYENYQPNNMKQMAVKLYAEFNNVSEVANVLNEKGYRKEGKLVAGKRSQVKLNSNDVTKLINSEIDEGDQLHPIIKGISNRNRRRQGIVI